MALNAADYGIEDLPEAGLSAVAVAAQSLSAAYQKLEAAEEEVKQLKAGILKIETEELPAALAGLGVKEITLENGEVVSVKEEVGVGITEVNRASAFNWLRAHGADSLIKRAVTVAFGKGEDADAENLLVLLQELHPDNQIVDKADIHYQTLKAWVKERLAHEKEQLAEGAPPTDALPRELFGVFVQQRATIKKNERRVK